ncbi:biliverdin-producing heme oxygenase [Thioalkalivibrio sp. ALMg11]|uniref:biliverdin-producing heme oxygenase n=1 Tax=Thioalkalivibrio sp. ALMg11 TaxID=1158165 RepID=UPI00037A6EB9
MTRYQRGRVHQALRRGTAAAHKALDHHRLMQRLTSSDLTREQYAESLAAMCRPHARLERWVHESRHHFESGLELSPRLERLEADLFELGQPAPVPPASQTPPDPSGGRAAWWGRVYVLEGSRHGSAVIARCIHSSLGDTAPCRFFGEAMVPGASRTLLAMLERELEDHDALEQAVVGAREAFAIYQAELETFDSRKDAVEMR